MISMNLSWFRGQHLLGRIEYVFGADAAKSGRKPRDLQPEGTRVLAKDDLHCRSI